MTRNTFETILARVVRQPDGCWLWQGHTKDGYGYARWEGREQGVHRIVYAVLVGPCPEDLQPDHLCRQRACCRPDHLEWVTLAENIRRGETGRHNSSKTHCPHGHPYSPENTRFVRRGPYLSRLCRVCGRADKKRRRQAQRVAA